MLTVNSQMPVASIGNPIATLNRSIHGPGLGRKRSHLGFQLNTTYGNARPSATVTKTSRITAAVCVKAKPSAGARNGAVHGVASTVASTPLKNAPPAPSRPATEPAAAPTEPSDTSNNPNRFSATSRMSTVNNTTNCGLDICMPQLANAPALFTPITTPASARNDTTTPPP